MTAYYNDSKEFNCDWLQNLIRDGLIPEGEVDDRPIQAVSADDVRGFSQRHWFAGIGGWAYALRLAGWPTPTGRDRSCPCQPYSLAGKRLRRQRPPRPVARVLSAHPRVPSSSRFWRAGCDGG